MKTHRLSREDYTRFVKNIGGARATLKKSIFDEFGPVRICSPGGRFLKIVRTDPGDAPEVDEPAEVEEVSDDAMVSQQASMKRMKNSGHVNRAPSPKGCRCAQWPWDDRQLDDRGKPRSHHPKCAFKKMWERQSGGHVKVVAAGPTLEARIHPAGKSHLAVASKAHSAGKVTNVNPAQPKAKLMGKPAKTEKIKEKVLKIPHPDNCPKCSQFTKSKKMLKEEEEIGSVQHYALCDYYKKYKAISLARKNAGIPAPKPEAPAKAKVMLFDLDQNAVVREAEDDEIEEGRARLRDEGTAFAEVDGKDYLLMYEDGSTVEPAEPVEPAPAVEASGEEAADTQPPPPSDVSEEEDSEAGDEEEAEAQAPAGA